MMDNVGQNVKSFINVMLSDSYFWFLITIFSSTISMKGLHLYNVR